MALGLMLLGTGLASILAPALLGPIVQDHGWRSATLAIAAAIFMIGVPVSLVTPADVKPAGDTGTKRSRGRFESNRVSVMLAVISCLLGVIVGGMIVHLIPMMIDRGMAIVKAAGLATALGAAVLCTRVVAGFLFDRFHAPFVAAILLASPLICCLVLLWGGPVVLAAILLGVAAGAEVDMLAYLTSRYVRMQNHVASYRLVFGLFCLGGGSGPMIFGWSVHWTGDYALALGISAFILAAIVVAIATLGPYRFAGAEHDGHFGDAVAAH